MDILDGYGDLSCNFGGICRRACLRVVLCYGYCNYPACRNLDEDGYTDTDVGGGINSGELVQILAME